MSLNGAVVIPARYASTRFPGKPLADIFGKPMIQHVFERCAEAVGVEKVFVATDGPEIEKAVEGFGGQVVFTSSNCLTGTDRLAEANEKLGCDFIINVQGDEPMTRQEDVRLVYEKMMSSSSDVINCYCDIKIEEIRMTSIPKVVVSETERLLYMSRTGIPWNKDDNPNARYKQVCIYGFSKSHLELFASQLKKNNK